MSDVTMDTRGLDRLLRDLPKEADAVVRKAAFDIEARAKRKAPVDTGALRNSIAVVDETRGDAEAEVNVGAEYGAYVELGTVDRAAKPYLAPAVEAVRPGFEKAMESLMKRLGDSR